MGCAGGSSKSSNTQNMSSTQTQRLHPVADNALFGPDGLFANAQNLAQNNPITAYTGQTYAGLNPTQNAALQGTLSYLGMGGGQSAQDEMARRQQSLQQQYNAPQQYSVGVGDQAQTFTGTSLADQGFAPRGGALGALAAGGDGPTAGQIAAGRDAAMQLPQQQGLDPRAIAADPEGFARWQQGRDAFMAQQSRGAGSGLPLGSGASAGSPYSGGAYAGYNALNALGSSLMGSQANQISLPGVTAQNVGGNTIDMSGIGGISAPSVGAVGVGGSGINYQDALNRSLSGQVDSPYLRQMMQDTADVSTQNFLRNVAPNMRSGAVLAGGYGGSRQGIAEGIATGDLNRGIQQSNTGLLGNLYESAQNRAASTAGNLSAQDAQARIASAQMAQQANMANAANALSSQQFNAQMGQQQNQFNASQAQQAALANQSAGLQAAGLNQQGLLSAFGLNQQAQQNALQNQMAGANMLNQASQIPMQNYQAMLNAGNIQQQDQQGALDAAYQHWQQQQMAPWTTAGMYQSLISPYVGLGATTDTTGTSSSLTRNSSTPGLFDWISMLKPG